MKKHCLNRPFLAPVFGLLALALASPPLQAQYRQDNLVSDIPGLAAHTDPNLVNPWGISSSASSPFWVSNADSGTSTLYLTSGTPIPLVVSVPSPTGQVFNSNGAAFNGDRFIFAGEDGTINGWRGALGTTAENLVNNSAAGASYKGIAVANIGTDSYLYAADFSNNKIYVLPSTGAPALTGTFTDPGLPAGYAPFNIQNLGDSLYVTYAKIGVGEEETGAGLGVVDKFDLNGNLLMRVVSAGGVLNAPWGVALAPTTFGQFAGDLLVGNFGDGTINAFDAVTGDLVGTLKDAWGNPLINEGLWGLRFGNGGSGGRMNTLYFAAGIDDEAHGLFGSFTPIPEPATYAFGGLALVSLCVALRQRRRKQAATSTPVAAV